VGQIASEDRQQLLGARGARPSTIRLWLHLRIEGQNHLGQMRPADPLVESGA
jgi:hypothetical protein